MKGKLFLTALLGLLMSSFAYAGNSYKCHFSASAADKGKGWSDSCYARAWCKHDANDTGIYDEEKQCDWHLRIRCASGLEWHGDVRKRYNDGFITFKDEDRNPWLRTYTGGDGLNSAWLGIDGHEYIGYCRARD